VLQEFFDKHINTHKNKKAVERNPMSVRSEHGEPVGNP